MPTFLSSFNTLYDYPDDFKGEVKIEYTYVDHYGDKYGKTTTLEMKDLIEFIKHILDECTKHD